MVVAQLIMAVALHMVPLGKVALVLLLLDIILRIIRTLLSPVV
jgi:hypothetical protein